MAKKKSVFEKLGLIEQIEEDLDEQVEDSIFETGEEFIKEGIEEDEEDINMFERDTVARTFSNKKNLDDDIIYENEELTSGKLYERDDAVVTKGLFTVASDREGEKKDELDPFEKIAQEQSARRERERIEAEIREYEKISQDFDKKSTNKEILLGVDEIYSKQGLNYDKRKTIFMVNEFIQALPESLPIEIKRNSVKNIVAASGINLNELMNDAYIRLETLNQTLQQQVEVTESIVAKSNKEIESLEAQILEVKKSITERNKKQEESKNAIEYETQRIINIVQFINPEE